MKPLDPRLLRYARATRAYLLLTVAVGAATAALVVGQAALIARLVDGGFLGGLGLAQMRGPLLALAAVLVARAVLAWATELAAHRSAALAKSQLRAALLEKAVLLAPGGGVSTADVATLATRGVDALDGYFSRYLPQLVLAVIVPVTVVAVLLGQDLVAAVIVGVTLPLIPLLMVVIGLATRGKTDVQLRTLQRLAGHFLDVVAGLPTLKVFGRAKEQARAIRTVTDQYRRSTIATLRLAFASSLVLELVATLSVALVAVSVGFRLLDSELTFRTALFVLVLAPEAYLPLRQVGANFHASAEGMAAAEQVFAVLAVDDGPHGVRTDIPDPSTHAIEVSGLTVAYPGRGEPALAEATLTVEPGRILAVAGPSGCGKSTLLAVLLGFVRPQSGQVRVGGVDLAELDPDAWRARVAWVPQRPHLFAGTLASNILAGRPGADAADLDAAVESAGLGPLVAGLPDGLQTFLGERGVGLSAGERQRVALARAFLRAAPLLLLDEPTAGLDAGTEAEVLAAVRAFAAGRTVVLVAHRPGLLALADQVVHLETVSALA